MNLKREENLNPKREVFEVVLYCSKAIGLAEPNTALVTERMEPGELYKG